MASCFASSGGESAPADAPEPALSEQSLIAVVDDDHSFRGSMQRLLKSLGYAVTAFPSAAEFLASPKLAATDCLIADVHMPAMTGIELYRYLLGAGPRIPTILITAYPDGVVRESLLALGVGCYLPKPLEEEALIECLRRALARRGVPRA